MITARMPSDVERRDLQIADGVPVLAVRRLVSRDGVTDEIEELHPADRVVLTYGQR